MIYNRSIKNSVLAVAFAMSAWFGDASQASASVYSSFSLSPATLNAGGTSELDLDLTVSADCCSNYNAQFTGGSVTLNSGLGPSQTFNITAGTTFDHFSATFNYPVAGNFTPSFSYSASYLEQNTQWYFYYSGYWYYYSYSCGFVQSCTGQYWVDTSHYAPYTYTNYNSQDGSGSQGLVVNSLAEADVSATPLPAALPLFATGLGAMGLLGWRRKRKAQAVA